MEKNNSNYPCDEKNRIPYPCDEPVKAGYPCDGPGKAAYPCDEPGKASYPCDERDPRQKGKGRRGGNSSGSIVIHSGNFRRDKETPDKPEGFRSQDRTRSGSQEYRGGNPKRNHKGSENRSERKAAVSDPGPFDTEIVDTSDIGAFVMIEGKKVLLPFSEQSGDPVKGDKVRVYLYEDKGGRPTATMRTPVLSEGETGILRVAAVTGIGAFLDNGVPKQVLLPFKEQIHTPDVGDNVLVYLYKDKSGRPAATMRVYSHLSRLSPYKADDKVSCFVYEINPKMGIFAAVDNKYYGMIPINESFRNYSYGDIINARVLKVRDDGKLDLLDREKLYLSTGQDADAILYELKKQGGRLPYADKADASFIEETYAMSKNQFKRALGYLYKQHLITIDRENDTITYIGS